MKKLIAALTVLAALPALAQTPVPATYQQAQTDSTQAANAVIKEWTGFTTSIPHLQTAVEQALQGMLNENSKLLAALKAQEDYWKAWCGDKPGCAVAPEQK